MKKKILITIIIIITVLVIAVAVIFGHFIKNDLTMENNLTKEVTEINLLIENNSKDTNIDKRLNTINTSGDYMLVEKAAKRYLKDKRKLFTSLYTTLDSTDRIEKVLTMENIKADAKSFTNTMKLLTFCSKKSLTSKVGDELRLLMLSITFENVLNFFKY